MNYERRRRECNVINAEREEVAQQEANDIAILLIQYEYNITMLLLFLFDSFVFVHLFD